MSLQYINLVKEPYKTPLPFSTIESPLSLAAIFKQLSRLSDKIYWFGDPILRERADDIIDEDFQSKNVQSTVGIMNSVLHDFQEAFGIGKAIAAPQVGIKKRIIVAIAGDLGSQELKVFINPRITWQSELKSQYCELCLSGIPLVADVIRPASIEVEYQDIFGNNRKLRPDLLLSRVLQHEIDHLDGILFIDRAEPKSIRFVTNLVDYKETAQLILLDNLDK